MDEETVPERTPSFYFGIELLRLWGALAIVWIHFGSARIPGVAFAVPCFVVISFFFSWKYLKAVDVVKLRRRLWRLAIPFFAWGIVSYFVALAIGTHTGITPLLWQLMLGHSTCAPLYYLFEVAVFVMLLFLLRKLVTGSLFWWMVTLLAIGCLCAQYTEVNHRVWSSLPFEASYPLGRIVELFPHAVAGCALAALDWKGWRAFIIGLVLFGCGTVMIKCPPFRVSAHFGYAGISYLLGASGLVLSATAWSGTKYSLQALCCLSAATAGVYYIHPIVGSVLNYFGVGYYSLVVFVSFFVVLLGLHLPWVCVLFNRRHPISLGVCRNREIILNGKHPSRI